MIDWTDCNEFRLFKKYDDRRITIPLSEYMALAALAQVHSMCSVGDASESTSMLSAGVEARIKEEFPVDHNSFFEATSIND